MANSTIFAGLGSGLDLNSIITQLMAVERQPINKLKARQDALRRQITALDGITSRLNSVSNVAASVANPSKWGTVKATSSDATVASVATSGQGIAGALSFTVTNLASAHSLRSASSVSATTAGVATPDSTITLTKGAASLGVSHAVATNAPTGKAELSVTRASAAASKAGTAVPGLVQIDPSNDTFFIDVNGVPRSVTIAHGTYDRSALAIAMNTAFANAGADVQASVSAGAIELSTLREGSAASLQVTGGTAPAALGMSTDVIAITGIDAQVSFQGVQTTLSSIDTGSTVVANGTNGASVSLTLAGGLRTGTATLAVVGTQDGSLSSVVDGINALRAQTGITAAAVRVGSAAYRLHVSSTTTGAASNVAFAPTTFAALGGMVESTQAQDAAITIGTGQGAYRATSTENTFQNLLPGVSVTALKAGQVSVTATADTRASEIAELVAKTNDLLSFISEQSRANPAAPGALSGDASVRRFADRVRSAVLSAQGELRVGISVDRSGKLTFDQAAYEAAYAADPDGVRNRFAQSISSVAGVTLQQAADRTVAGSHAIVVTQAATRATTTLNTWATPLEFSQGGTSATYTAGNGAAAGDVAAGLNAMFSTSALGLTARVDGAAVVVESTTWGSNGGFSLNAGSGSQSFTGLDVAGTIAGVAASGAGRVLTAAPSSAADGLRLTITATTAGALGTVAYNPGVAGTLRQLALTSTENSSPLRAAKSSRESRMQLFTDQMAALERRVKAKEAQMRRQYSALDSNIGKLQGTSAWLAQQTAAKQS